MYFEGKPKGEFDEWVGRLCQNGQLYSRNTVKFKKAAQEGS